MSLQAPFGVIAGSIELRGWARRLAPASSKSLQDHIAWPEVLGNLALGLTAMAPWFRGGVGGGDPVSKAGLYGVWAGRGGI